MPDMDPSSTPELESPPRGEPPATQIAAVSGLATHLQALAEKEKSAIARTLHDELGGLLTAAKMDLSWLQSRVQLPELQERLTQLGGVLDEAMSLKRRVVEDLRPSLLDHFGLPTALRTYVGATCAQSGLQVQVEIADEAQSLPGETAIALFRIVQEGLGNIIRHAGAKHVRLVLIAGPQRHEVTLTDDGCGFDAAAVEENARLGRTFGLTGMRQRVHSFGGALAISSAQGRGTTVQVEVPRQ